jgi:predicted cobalt transporter CbtA
VSLGYGAILKSALLAGVIAALVVATFHFVVTEPLIEQAIALEETAADHHEATAPVVSREAQRVGLFVGWLMYGVTWALLFSVVFQLTRGYSPDASLRQRSLVVAAGALWAVCLVPFLKYPANPPGVGEPESIAYRQMLYIGILALAIAGTVVSAVVAGFTAQRTSQPFVPWVAGIGFLIVYSLVIGLVLPDNPDPIKAPMDLVGQFRVSSAVGLVLFWFIMGPAFAFFAGRSGETRSLPVPRAA